MGQIERMAEGTRRAAGAADKLKCPRCGGATLETDHRIGNVTGLHEMRMVDCLDCGWRGQGYQLRKQESDEPRHAEREALAQGKEDYSAYQRKISSILREAVAEWLRAEVRAFRDRPGDSHDKSYDDVICEAINALSNRVGEIPIERELTEFAAGRK